MSLAGSFLLLAYFIWGRNDSVGIISNLFPAWSPPTTCASIRATGAGPPARCMAAAARASIPGERLRGCAAAPGSRAESMGRKMTGGNLPAPENCMDGSGHPVPCTRMACDPGAISRIARQAR
jgi:hypothetical protein